MKKILSIIVLLVLNAKNINSMNNFGPSSNSASQESSFSPTIFFDATTEPSYKWRLFYNPPVSYSEKRVRNIIKFLKKYDSSTSSALRAFKKMEEYLIAKNNFKRQKKFKNKKKWSLNKINACLLQDNKNIRSQITTKPSVSISAPTTSIHIIAPFSDSNLKLTSALVPFSVPTPLPDIPKQTSLPSTALLSKPNSALSETKTTPAPQATLSSVFSNMPLFNKTLNTVQQNSNCIPYEIEPAVTPQPWPPAVRSIPLKIVYYPYTKEFNARDYSRLPNISKNSRNNSSTSPILLSSSDTDFFQKL